MKKIPLTHGLFTLVDDADYEFLNQWKWHADEGDSTFYARRNVKRETISSNGNDQQGVRMHRIIMGVTDPKVHVDHIDHNGLNNQRHNLRICTKYENSKNKKISKRKKSSKFLGVFYDKRKKNKPWLAKIRHNWILIHIGQFNTEIEAAIAYNKKSIELNGSFASLNPEEVLS